MNEFSSNQNASLVVFTTKQIQDLIKLTVEQTTAKLLAELDHSNQDTYLSVKTVCDKFSINKSTLYRWTKEEYVPVHKVGGRRLYRLDEIKSIIDKGFNV